MGLPRKEALSRRRLEVRLGHDYAPHMHSVVRQQLPVDCLAPLRGAECPHRYAWPVRG
jgi:hypothetical protein